MDCTSASEGKLIVALERTDVNEKIAADVRFRRSVLSLILGAQAHVGALDKPEGFA